MEQVVGIILSIVGIYLLIGLLFAIPFVAKGAAKIDPAAQAATWGFKVLILPGVIAFWPLLAKRWKSGNGEPPEECSPHRACGGCDVGAPHE